MFKTGHNILNNSKKAAREYSEKEAYEKLSTTMYELQMDKETNKDYNQNDFINNKIIQEGYQIGGDIVKVGEYLFKIDRNIPAITKNLGKSSDQLSDADLIIDDAESFIKFKDDVNNGNTYEGKKVILLGDIDLSKYCSENIGSWTPIGANDKEFKGTFDGNNYILSNLYINSTENYQGLFGTVTNGTIKNLNIKGNIKGGNSLGLIAGKVTGGNISNIKTTSDSNVNGTYYIGGLVGNADNNTKFEKCENGATVSGTACYVGGITGIRGAITQSCNKGNISGVGHIGGITGNGLYTTTITYCYNLGKITGNGDDGTGYSSVGGIAGSSTRTLYCYNRGDVYGAKGQAAGMVGNNYGAGGTAINYCYNTGVISGYGRAIGSIMGECNETAIANCVYTSGPNALGYRGSESNCRRITDEQMKSYTDEYFKTDTKNINDGYPILEWQLEN